MPDNTEDLAQITRKAMMPLLVRDIAAGKHDHHLDEMLDEPQYPEIEAAILARMGKLAGGDCGY